MKKKSRTARVLVWLEGAIKKRAARGRAVRRGRRGVSEKTMRALAERTRKLRTVEESPMRIEEKVMRTHLRVSVKRELDLAGITERVKRQRIQETVGDVLPRIFKRSKFGIKRREGYTDERLSELAQKLIKEFGGSKRKAIKFVKNVARNLIELMDETDRRLSQGH